MSHSSAALQAVFAPRPFAPSPDAIFRPDGSILGVRPPQLPDRGAEAPATSPPSTPAPTVGS